MVVPLVIKMGSEYSGICVILYNLQAFYKYPVAFCYLFSTFNKKYF